MHDWPDKLDIEEEKAMSTPSLQRIVFEQEDDSAGLRTVLPHGHAESK
jgi:hypothetical protein